MLEKWKQIKADFALLCVAFIWGTTFVVVQNALSGIGPFYFNGIRFMIAFLFLAAIFWKRIREITLPALKTGAFIGIFLFGGYAFQTIGLQYTGAANAGFITGLSVVLVPVFSALLSRRYPKINTLVGVTCATAGLMLLTLSNNLAINTGDLFCFLCAICFGLHIILVGKLAVHFDSPTMAILQIGTVSVISFLCAVFLEPFPTYFTKPVWIAFIITAIPATSLAFLIQNTVQKYTSPTHTAIIFTTEPVFAALTAFVFTTQVLSLKQWLGCLLILAGMLVSELKLESVFKQIEN
ncbi:MAG TPA: DMT family transporter [Clostridia bacterium]|nr:DMT family transporter [Clostridia bacterium]